MEAPPVSLGYVILYVDDVAAALAFYEEAFSLTRRFFHDDNGKAYGELETGATRLAFASLALAETQLKEKVVAASLNRAPLGVEIALVTPDVPALYARAVNAGAMAMSESRQRSPGDKRWHISAMRRAISLSCARRCHKWKAIGRLYNQDTRIGLIRQLANVALHQTRARYGVIPHTSLLLTYGSRALPSPRVPLSPPSWWCDRVRNPPAS
jgi:uncharacterized glyoxalase superfamily protein PhnB